MLFLNFQTKLASRCFRKVRYGVSRMAELGLDPQVGGFSLFAQMRFFNIFMSGARALLCPAAWHVRPDHLPAWSEWLQRLQIRSLRTRQRSPPLPLQKVNMINLGPVLTDPFIYRANENGFQLFFFFRANENGGLLTKVEKEKSLLKQELVARIKVWFLIILCTCHF